MRTPQATDYAVIRDDIQTLQREATMLEAQRDERAAELNAQLAVSSRDFNEGRVRELRAEMSGLARRLELVGARISARSAALPSENARAEAEAQGRRHAASADEAARAFHQAWQVFVAALRAALDAARDVIEARRVVMSEAGRLSDLVHRFGIDVAVPVAPAPPSREALLAGYIAQLLTPIGFECVSDDQLEVAVRNAEREVDAAAPKTAA